MNIHTLPIFITLPGFSSSKSIFFSIYNFIPLDIVSSNTSISLSKLEIESAS